MNGKDEGTGKVRDYVSQRMNVDMPPDFVGGVMNEVRQTPQRGRRQAWPLVASFATIAAAVAVVGIGLSLVDDRGGVGSSVAPSASVGTSPSLAPSQAPETAAPSTEAPSSAEPLPSGEFGPVWQMQPGVAFADSQSCANPFGLPSAELSENVAWRIWLPGGWYTAESYIGECFWFGPQPWEQDLEDAIPPDEVAIAISLLDGRVTPTSDEFEGGTITREEPFTVDGLPAVRYEIEGSEGEFLNGDGVVWIIGVEGQLPVFVEGGEVPNYMSVFTSSTEAGRLAQQVEVLDRMVATLRITDQ